MVDSWAGNAPMSTPKILPSSRSWESGGPPPDCARARLREYALTKNVPPPHAGSSTAVVRAADAEGVNEVHHVGRRVELSEAPALAGAYEPLVHLADYVEVQIGEIELLDAPNEARPVPGGRGRRERDRVADVFHIPHEYGLVVVGVLNGFADLASRTSRSCSFDTVDSQQGHLPEPATQHLVEDQAGQQYVARQPRRAFQVLPVLLPVRRRLPTLGQHPRVQAVLEPRIGCRQFGESVSGVGDRVFQRAFEPADEALADGGRLESAAFIDKVGEPFEEVSPEPPDGVPRPILEDFVADRRLDHVRRPLDVALGVRHVPYVGVEQDELSNVPGEAVSHSRPGSLVQSVIDQIGVQRVIALSRVGHLDLSGQDGLTGVTPVQPEVVPPRSAAHVVFDGRAAEWQVRPTIEELGNPACNFGGEGAFVNWHMSGPECGDRIGGWGCRVIPTVYQSGWRNAGSHRRQSLQFFVYIGGPVSHEETFAYIKDKDLTNRTSVRMMEGASQTHRG